jgi:glyoxylase-like metal-dependent hydrolase (beta-lactamase superfamily II)
MMPPPVALDPQRRALLAAALAAPWMGSAAGSAQAAPAGPDSAEAVEPVEVEAGVYLLPGRPGPVTADNLGRVGNAGFIIGRRAVMVIDSGTSHRHGQALLAAIAQVTPLPVQLALVTHARQEFVFGASAYQARGIPVHMQRDAAALMAARCENCLKLLRAELGDEPMRDTRVFKPDVLFEQTHVIETLGRPVLVQAHGHASSPGDTSVFDVRSGTLFAGGLLDNRQIPDIQDSDLDGWRRAWSSFRGLRISTIVPGHGAATTPDLVAINERYLSQLERRCARLLKDGAALSEVPDAADLPDFSRWALYDTVHRRNASIMFLRLERQLLLAEPAQGAPR